MVEETVDIDSRDACTVDEPMDDYQSWHEEPLSEIQQDEEALCVLVPLNLMLRRISPRPERTGLKPTVKVAM